MKDLPLVSYIIPNYNQGKYLYDAISSAILSYSGPKEIFLIDDCSTDPTTKRRIEEIYKIFPNLNIIYNNSNKGLSATRNIGLSLCKGDFIQFLDADDLLFPRKIDMQIQHFIYGNQLDISLTDFILIDESLSEMTYVEPSIGTFELSLSDFLYHWERGLMIPIHSALFRKEIFSDIKFDESLTAKEDWLFWCITSMRQKRISFLNVLGAAYRQHHDAMTKKNIPEMGRMWLKSTLIIDNILGYDNRFLSTAIEWYHKCYEKNEKEIEKNEQINNGNLTISQKIHIPDPNSYPKLNVPFFSIIIPIYNHFDFLSKCIQSILDQSFKDYEIICINDNSSDKKVEFFLDELRLNFASPRLTILLNETNYGISKTINNGIENAKGKYIVFIDCDDYIPKNALADVYKYLINDPTIDYLFTDKIDIDENNLFIRRANYGGYKNIRPTEDIKNDLLDGMVASHLKVIRKSIISDVGGLKSEFDGVQDYELALRIANKGKFKYLNRPLYYHRQHKSSITSSDTIQQFRKENIARRRACNQWYPKNINREETIGLFLEKVLNNEIIIDVFLEEKKIKLFSPKNFSLERVKKDFINGYLCFFDGQGEPLGEWTYFLREYNSYFDLIIIDDLQIAIFILNYLWDFRILQINSTNLNKNL